MLKQLHDKALLLRNVVLPYTSIARFFLQEETANLFLQPKKNGSETATIRIMFKAEKSI